MVAESKEAIMYILFAGLRNEANVCERSDALCRRQRWQR